MNLVRRQEKHAVSPYSTAQNMGDNVVGNNNEPKLVNVKASSLVQYFHNGNLPLVVLLEEKRPE